MKNIMAGAMEPSLKVHRITGLIFPRIASVFRMAGVIPVVWLREV